MLGLFGLTIILLEVLIHLASLKSFGVPYLSPLASPDTAKLKDVIIRAPLWSMPHTDTFRQNRRRGNKQ